jgi:hypothetical protein
MQKERIQERKKAIDRIERRATVPSIESECSVFRSDKCIEDSEIERSTLPLDPPQFIQT